MTPKRINFFVCLLAFFVALAASPAYSASLPAVSSDLPPEIQRLYDAGHYREAVEALEAAVSANRTEAPLQFWLGRCFYELRDYSRAISSFERATALEPNRSEYHDWLGRAYGRKAEESGLFATFSSFALARRTNREFQTAVRLDPANLEAERDYIRYLVNAPGIVGGSEERAQDQIQALATVDAVQADLARADLLATHRKFDEAGQKYMQVMAVKSARVGVYLEVAAYFADRNDAPHLDQAVDQAALAAQADPRIPYYRGIALVLNKKDARQAEQDFRNYLANVPESSDFPSHALAHEWLAKLYESEGKREQAIGEYQAALTLDPRNKALREALKQVEK